MRALVELLTLVVTKLDRLTSAALARAVGARPLYFPSALALATPSR
jgi:hypothetical protein